MSEGSRSLEETGSDCEGELRQCCCSALDIAALQQTPGVNIDGISLRIGHLCAPLLSNLLQRDFDATSPPLRTVDEYAPSQDGRWMLSPEGTESSLHRELSHDSREDEGYYVDDERPKMRPGSMPPAPTHGFGWKLDCHNQGPISQRSSESSHVAATPIPMTNAQASARSRSLGYGLSK